MELQQLKYFLLLAESENVTKAAASLHIAQPALSQSIKRLEKELGVQLFQRTGRRLHLNEAGKFFEEKVKPLMQTLDALPRQVQDISGMVKRTVRVSALSASQLSTEIIIAYRELHPEVNFIAAQVFDHNEWDICFTSVSTDIAAVEISSAKTANAVSGGNTAGAAGGKALPSADGDTFSISATPGALASETAPSSASPGALASETAPSSASPSALAGETAPSSASPSARMAHTDALDAHSTAAFDEEIFLAVPRDKLSKYQPVDKLSSFADAPFITFTGAKPFKAICDHLCAIAGFTPHLAFQSDNPTAVRNLIAAGLGVAFWPSFSWGPLNSSQVELLHITAPICRRRLLIRKSDVVLPGSMQEDFFRFAIDYIQKLRDEASAH